MKATRSTFARLASLHGSRRPLLQASFHLRERLGTRTAHGSRASSKDFAESSQKIRGSRFHCFTGQMRRGKSSFHSEWSWIASESLFAGGRGIQGVEPTGCVSAVSVAVIGLRGGQRTHPRWRFTVPCGFVDTRQLPHRSDPMLENRALGRERTMRHLLVAIADDWRYFRERRQELLISDGNADLRRETLKKRHCQPFGSH